jgi:hypothetical protein
MCAEKGAAGANAPARPAAATGREWLVLHVGVPRKIELLFFDTGDKSVTLKQSVLLWKTTRISLKQQQLSEF